MVRVAVRGIESSATWEIDVPWGSRSGDSLVAIPGMVDLQVNGFAGTDFTARGLDVAAVLQAIGAIRRTGVLWFAPTVVSAPQTRMLASISTIRAAIEEAPEAARSVAGIHLEGPFLSAQPGARGAHPRRWVGQVSEALFQDFQAAAGGRIRIVTIAPELVGAIRFIERRADEGVLVAIGHTSATPEVIQAAVAAGARLSTHLGNGTAVKLDRHRSPVLAQLGEDALTASFIADGEHLPPSVLRSFIRAKMPERSILITDSTAAAGLGPGSYTLAGRRVTVDRTGAACRLASGAMAGSSLTMGRAVANVLEWSGLPMAEVVAMATTRPGQLLGFRPSVGPGVDEYLLASAEADGFQVRAVVSNGSVLPTTPVNGPSAPSLTA